MTAQAKVKKYMKVSVPKITVSDMRKEPIPTLQLMRERYSKMILTELSERSMNLKPLQYIRIDGTSAHMKSLINKQFKGTLFTVKWGHADKTDKNQNWTGYIVRSKGKEVYESFSELSAEEGK